MAMKRYARAHRHLRRPGHVIAHRHVRRPGHVIAHRHVRRPGDVVAPLKDEFKAKQQKENPTEACTSRSSGERICNLILSVTQRSAAANVLTSTGDMELSSEI